MLTYSVMDLQASIIKKIRETYDILINSLYQLHREGKLDNTPDDIVFRHTVDLVEEGKKRCIDMLYNLDHGIWDTNIRGVLFECGEHCKEAIDYISIYREVFNKNR